MTSIEWVKGDDGSPGLSWNALRAERTIERKGKTVTVSANHCEHVNEACRFCYAERGNYRLGGLAFKPGHRKDYTFIVDEEKLLAPIRRKKPTRIFVESMSDAFGEWWPTEFINKLYAVMALCPQHTFINLSKRPKRRREYLDDPLRHNTIELAAEKVAPSLANLGRKHMLPSLPFKNVIEGTSVSNQAEANEFIPELLRTRAALRCLSVEPLLGEIDLNRLPREPDDEDRKMPGFADVDRFTISALWGERGLRMKGGREWFSEHDDSAATLDWVIVGGESGPNARPMNPEWARNIRDQCQHAGVAFFFKQWGEYLTDDGYPGESHRVGKKAAGRLLDNVEHSAFPQVRT